LFQKSDLIKRKYSRMGMGAKKKQRERTKVQAGKKEPQRGEPHEGKGSTKCKNLH
jgi:hypothetical protein